MPGEPGTSRSIGFPSPPSGGIPMMSGATLSAVPTYTIRRIVPEVRLQFSVADEHGRLLRNLSAEDIRILEDQSPVTRLVDFARDENLPLRLGIILDVSDSVKRALPEEKEAAIEFLDRALRSQADRAFVMAFGGTFQVWQRITSDRARLLQAVSQAHQPEWGTVLFDAVYSACIDQMANADDSIYRHRAIVVLSDGNDTHSLRALPDVIAAAQRSEIQVYALTLHLKGLRPAGDTNLQRLADETGGGFFVAQSPRELRSAFAEIEQEMRTQYSVSFPPQDSTPGFHALRVEVQSPQKVRVHARRGYYAMAR